MPKSILTAMEAPRISASDVETEASTAVTRALRETHLGRWSVAASERQKPVVMPRCATLCWRMTSMTVDRVTIHSSV
jgi:hypothetical protein